jgi:hypothetical protein
VTRSLPWLSLPHLSDEAVVAFADGALLPGPFARAQHHLSECTECAQAVRDQQAARGLLRAAAAPAAPGALLERLRQLPTSSPLGGGLVGGMTADGQPVFAAYHTRQRQPAPTTTSMPTVAAPVPASAAQRPHRSHLPVLGASAAAAATVIVGVLAGTAATAGGSAAPNQRPPAPVVTTVTVPAVQTDVSVLNLTGRR